MVTAVAYQTKLEEYDSAKLSRYDASAKLGKAYAGPFIEFDLWRLLTQDFLGDVFVKRMCEHMNDVWGDGSLFVEDPIALAQCLSMNDLSLDVKVTQKRVDMMQEQGWSSWDEILKTGKKLFLLVRHVTAMRPSC